MSLPIIKWEVDRDLFVIYEAISRGIIHKFVLLIWFHMVSMSPYFEHAQVDT